MRGVVCAMALSALRHTILRHSRADITECGKLRTEFSLVTSGIMCTPNFVNFRLAILYLRNMYLRISHEIVRFG
jgi:hypothetical protein